MEKSIRYIIKDREQTTIAEAFRAIRASLQTAQEEANFKTVLFVGASAGEGSAMTAVNTAVALAYTGKKVVLVDMDLRTPIIQDVFGLQRTGVTDIINEEKSLDQVMQKSNIDGLTVLTSGTTVKQPQEVLSSDKLRKLLDHLKSTADYIIINTAPLLLTSNTVISDSCVLASKVDGVVLVIDSRAVRVHTAQRALQLLKGAKAKLIGSVMNNVEAEEDFICPFVSAG